MHAFDPAAYPATVRDLLAEERLMELGPGTPNAAVRDQLAALSAADLFEGKVRDREMARACLSGLWLYHDYLDESHTISQDLGSATGSYWHGIMHRREPDPGNSKYWFHRVGRHPVFDDLAAAAAELDPEHLVTSAGDWEPFAFIDACEAARTGRSEHAALCRQIQLHEWQLLFDFCYRTAGA